MDKCKILIVDDEESICEILKFNLEVHGYQVDVAYSAQEALELKISTYSLILLDVMMGRMSGFHMARLLKSDPQTASVPIIFCTALGSKDDAVTGLDLGADDYITKPFSVREVAARIKNVLRRSGAVLAKKQNDGSLEFRTLKIDLGKKQCRMEEKEVWLTKKEFEILALFLRHPGIIFSRTDILARIWSDEVIVVDRTVDVNITRLRKKIGEYGKHIVTRQGYGYGFEPCPPGIEFPQEPQIY